MTRAFGYDVNLAQGMMYFDSAFDRNLNSEFKRMIRVREKCLNAAKSYDK